MHLENQILLGVNIDHVATVRQARGVVYPDPVQAAVLVEKAGAHNITAHLREDRRHIQDRDIYMLKEILQIPLNLEMAATQEMVAIAKKVKPAHCCIVPEKRQELTTEGGLDVIANEAHIKKVCHELRDAGIEVSLFISDDIKQIEATIRCGAPAIEIHTGCYADATDLQQQQQELEKIIAGAKFAKQSGLIVNAGHGLHYQNTQAIAAISELSTLNIGHAIVARAVLTGMDEAVKTMLQLMSAARS